jgi:hypothetical protein
MGWVNSLHGIRPLRSLVAFWLQLLVALVPIAQWHPDEAFFWLARAENQEVTGEGQDVAAYASLSASLIAKKLVHCTAVTAPTPMADLSSFGRPSHEGRQSIAWPLENTAAPRGPPSLTLQPLD